MPNEFNPTAAPGVPYRFPWMSVYTPVIPCTFDGSLSLLEMCGKMLRALNEVISVTNNTQSDMVQLAAYVAEQVANMYDIINTHDSTTLADAKEYTDGAIAALRTYVDTQDNAKLSEAQQYTDNAIATLRSYVDTQLDGKQNTLTFDTTPTSNSDNPVTSNGIRNAIDALNLQLQNYVAQQLAGKQDTLTFDTSPRSGSNNPVTSNGIKNAIDAIPAATIYTMHLENGRDLVTSESVNSIIITAARSAGQAIWIRYDKDDGSREWFRLYGLAANNASITFESSTNILTGILSGSWTITARYDTNPTVNSGKPVTSGGVYLSLLTLQRAVAMNIEVDVESGTYSSTTTYAQIKNKVDDVLASPPFVSLYDDDEGTRVAIYYYSHMLSDGSLIFAILDRDNPSAISRYPAKLKCTSSNVWSSTT